MGNLHTKSGVLCTGDDIFRQDSAIVAGKRPMVNSLLPATETVPKDSPGRFRILDPGEPAIPGSCEESVIGEWRSVICNFRWITLKKKRFEAVRKLSQAAAEAASSHASMVEGLIKEDRELAGIPGASIRTAQAKAARIRH